MPEPPEIYAFNERLQRINRRLNYPDFHLQIFPRIWPASSYKTCQVNREAYTDVPAATEEDFVLHDLDVQRAEGQPYEHLLRTRSHGRLHCAARAKQLVVACGQHAVTVSFGLEAHVMGMSRACFDEVVAASVPGSNSTRADQQHSFPIPLRYNEPSSSHPLQTRTINILLAWVSPSWVWALVDFSRLVRFLVVSRNKPWENMDIRAGSTMWPIFFAAFATGPDWNYETDAAMTMTDQWRERVLATARIANKPILDILCSSDEPCFYAFGRHTANDFLHSVAIFPGAPAIFICRSNSRFIAFKTGIAAYMNIWVARAFLRLAGGIPNTLNPFAYNYKSFVVYYPYLLVFRRSHVYVPCYLYNMMLRAGLFNPQHVIGHKYTLKSTDVLCIKQSRRMRVYFRAGLKCYTCIRAIAPGGWKTGFETCAVDLRFAGYATTIGLAEFHEMKVNRLNFEFLMKSPQKLVGSPGRKPKVELTGLPGRPRKRWSVRRIRSMVCDYAASKYTCRPIVVGDTAPDIVKPSCNSQRLLLFTPSNTTNADKRHVRGPHGDFIPRMSRYSQDGRSRRNIYPIEQQMTEIRHLDGGR